MNSNNFIQLSISFIRVLHCAKQEKLISGSVPMDIHLKDMGYKYQTILLNKRNNISGINGITPEVPLADNLYGLNGQENIKSSETPKNLFQSGVIDIQSIKKILINNQFIKPSSLLSLMIFSFNESHYTFRVVTLAGELCKANGRYTISPAPDESLAKITLIEDGPVHKSPFYEDSQGIETELFLFFNRELLLKPFTDSALNQLNLLDLAVVASGSPEYLLSGRDTFVSSSLEEKDEMDLIKQ